MKAATIFRIAISCFIALLIIVAPSGWRWAGSHQPPAQASASRTVLGLYILTGLVGLAVWRSGRR